MKKLILLSGLLIAGLSINAQTAAKTQTANTQNQNEDPAVRATNQTEKMAQELSLTADQKAKAYAINLDKNKQIDASKRKNANDKVAFQNDRKIIRSQRENELKAILTPDQITKYNKMREDSKARKGANDGDK